MHRPFLLTLFGTAVLASSWLIGSGTPKTSKEAAQDPHHVYRVMTSRFCASCHPAIYAEHAENTHGRAFTDAEVRLATGRFGHGDCIRCHTPRPVFETGIGLNPVRRHHGLEEGNTCMSCHFKAGQDYSRFQGGADCKSAFDDRVGSVEACASCHRNHGTPYQWARAPTGRAAGKKCISCHMQLVKRPVAVGETPRMVRAHVFPGVRSERQVRRAYKYTAAIDGNEVVIKVKNKGCGHNFPTELKQRSVESVVVVRDTEGREVGRSRMIFRDPYKRPYGLHLPINTQIPAGQTREHRVPIKVAAGSVECELHFKLYYPIEDHHPDLSRMLEQRRLVFDGVTPSNKKIESAPVVRVKTPENIPPEIASAPNLVDYVRPKIGTVKIEMPEGTTAADIKQLIDFFQFPVPEANRLAQVRLVEIGKPAIPALIEALGSWDNKTFKQSMKVLRQLDEAAPALLDALSSDQLYVRLHARKIIAEMGWAKTNSATERRLIRDLARPHPVDRISAAEAIGSLGCKNGIGSLRALLQDKAPDAVRAAALSLAKLEDKQSAAVVAAAMRRAFYAETRRDLAFALARLGSADGIPTLLHGLDHPDELIRESFFERLHAATGMHAAFDPLAPRPDRLMAISRLQGQWAKIGGPSALAETQIYPGDRLHHISWNLVQKLGQDDRLVFDELVDTGEDAVTALVLGLKYPPGFADKRSRICAALGRIGNKHAAPYLAAALRDPVIAVAAWAAAALETCGDPEILPSLRRFQKRLLTLAANGLLPPAAGTRDQLHARVARTRLMLGDSRAKRDLVNLLLSNDGGARHAAIEALEARYNERRGYNPDATPNERRTAAKAWLE